MRALIPRIWSDESGVSAIEMALVSAVILVPLLLGSTELGRRIWVKAELDNAVRVGLEYIMIKNSTSIAGADVQNVAQSATKLSTAVAVSPPSACAGAYSCFGCPTTSGVTLTSTSTTCAAGNTSGTYAGLTASYSYTPLLHACGGFLPTSICPLSSAATTWSSTAFARIQ